MLLTPKPHVWGSWRINSNQISNAVNTTTHKEKESDKEEEEGEVAYKPHSPYYSPVHPPEF